MIACRQSRTPSDYSDGSDSVRGAAKRPGRAATPLPSTVTVPGGPDSPARVTGHAAGCQAEGYSAAGRTVVRLVLTV